MSTKLEQQPDQKASTVGGLYNKAYSVQCPLDNVLLYRDWARNYDSDTVGDLQYVGPARTVDIFLKFYNAGSNAMTPNLKILDAGCGTGLVGEELVKKLTGDDDGKATDENCNIRIDGMDISKEMLEVASVKNVYRELKVVDMTQFLPYETACYDACLCVGTFTHGHVPPSPAIRELVRIVKPGGYNVFTVHEQVWESMDFPHEIGKIQDQGICKIVEVSKEPYIQTKGYHSYTVVLQTL